MVALGFTTGVDKIVNLADPIWGDHAPLTHGWSDRQLRPIAQVLKSRLSPHLTEGMLLSVASQVRSAVTQHLIDGRGIFYSRSRSFYESGRYRNDPRCTYFFVVGGANALRDSGLVKHHMGVWVPRNKGARSTMYVTQDLLELVAPLIDIDESRELRKGETIILRDRDDKSNVEYRDTPETLAMRQDLLRLNDNVRQLEIRYQGNRFDPPPMRRIFNGDFTRGGRLYAHGESWQNMPKAERQALTIIIDGTPHPVVERDFATLHPRMAYAHAGKRCPAGDLYDIEGFDRGLIKLAVNVLFNATSKGSALAAIHAEIMKHPQWRWTTDRDTLAARVVNAIRRRHHRIKKFFHSDCGATFQRWDSEIAIEVMSRMVELTGRCPLPVHDSFIVAARDAAILQGVMDEALVTHGIAPKPTTKAPTPSHPYPLGGHKVLPAPTPIPRQPIPEPHEHPEHILRMPERVRRRDKRSLREILLSAVNK
jgi:hypothetical protein